ESRSATWRRMAATPEVSWRRGRNGISTGRRIPGHRTLRCTAAGGLRRHGGRLRGVRPRARYAGGNQDDPGLRRLDALPIQEGIPFTHGRLAPQPREDPRTGPFGRAMLLYDGIR